MQCLTGSGLTCEQHAESLVAMCRPHAQLEADLVELGQPIPPASQMRPDLSDGQVAWWGRVYVLEGSRQGSAVIARCVHCSLGDSVPCRFFGGTIVPEDFSRLLATLEHELEDEDAFEQAVAGAREAFADYRAELDAFDSRKRDFELR
ncbi:biliverdin-producing heme oxygenase [Thioalkalivibrio sp.]